MRYGADRVLTLLRLPAKLHAAQLGDGQLQMFDLERARRELLAQLGDHCLQGINVVWQCGRGRFHERSLRLPALATSPVNNGLQGAAWTCGFDWLPPIEALE